MQNLSYEWGRQETSTERAADRGAQSRWVPEPQLGTRYLPLKLVIVICMASRMVMGQDPTPPPSSSPSGVTPAVVAPAKLEKPAGNWMPLTKDHEVWVDLKQKQLLVGGRICLREGVLEMFACPRGTKEHESIVAVNTPARFVHAGLVALNAKPGPPVQFQPKYKPAQGTEVEVFVYWKGKDAETKRVKAQDWVRQIKTGESLQYPWVFAGSGFWTDVEAGEKFYYADGGEFICVSNFSTAMLDLPVESSDANDTLLFSAFTDRIPPRETPVYLILKPKSVPSTAPQAKKSEPAKEAKTSDPPGVSSDKSQPGDKG